MRKVLILGGLMFASLVAIGADWLTDGGNPQRTAWQKDEKTVTTENVKNMKLLWKVKTDNMPREMHSLLPALIVSRVTTSSGPKEIAVVTGVSDNIYAIDVENGTLLWKKHFEFTAGALPRWHHRDSRYRSDEHTRQVHNLCRVMGWPAPSVKRGGRCGRSAAFKIH